MYGLCIPYCSNHGIGSVPSRGPALVLSVCKPFQISSEDMSIVTVSPSRWSPAASSQCTAMQQQRQMRFSAHADTQLEINATRQLGIASYRYCVNLCATILFNKVMSCTEHL